MDGTNRERLSTVVKCDGSECNNRHTVTLNERLLNITVPSCGTHVSDEPERVSRALL